MSQFLLDHIKKQFPDSSHTKIKKWIKEGRVLVDKKKITNPLHPLKSPAVSVNLISKEKKLELDIKLLHQDQDIVVIHKPAGVLSVATLFEKEQTAHQALKKKFPFVHPVHRLDRETSGVMMFALSKRAKLSLKDLFVHHRIYREYHAVVWGNIEENDGTWKSKLLENQEYFVSSSPKGALAITHYRVLKRYKNTTRIQCILETGKKNQIRAQALENNHPVLGDLKYSSSSFANPSSKTRLHLHSYKMSFIHPFTEKKMVFCEETPF